MPQINSNKNKMGQMAHEYLLCRYYYIFITQLTLIQSKWFLLAWCSYALDILWPSGSQMLYSVVLISLLLLRSSPDIFLLGKYGCHVSLVVKIDLLGCNKSGLVMWFSKLQKLVCGSITYLIGSRLTLPLARHLSWGKCHGPSGCLSSLFSPSPS